MPSVDTLARDFKGRGLEVLLVSFREDPEHVKRTVKERGYRARVVLDESGDVTGRGYGVWGPPTVYFVDRTGRLVGRAVGARAWDTAPVRSFIEALLEAPAGR